MKFFATLALAATAVVAQQVGSSSEGTFSGGENAVSNPNINNGQQFTNALVDGGDKGGNVFHGLKGNQFSDVTSNTGLSDNNFINPSQDNVEGNHGETTNGVGNNIGDFVQGLGGVGGFHRRDVIRRRDFIDRRSASRRDAVVNNFGHSEAWGHPIAVEPFAPVVGVPVRPHAGFAGPGHVNHNQQNAAIVQNQV
ncbi:hypothetical protein IWW50_000672 [Coemansia erecta]|nr:hypothetical protein IWW50_000672 [Coemansia erecta]